MAPGTTWVAWMQRATSLPAGRARCPSCSSRPRTARSELRQRLQAPRLDRRRRAGKPEEPAVLLPRVDVRPGRVAPRRARREDVDLSDISLVRFGSSWGPFRFVNLDDGRRRSPSCSATSRSESRPRASTSTRSCSTTARTGRSRPTGRSPARTSSSATTARLLIPGSRRRSTSRPTTTSSRPATGTGASSGNCGAAATRSPVGQFHFIWPNTGINIFPGRLNLSIGPILPLAPDRTRRVLDYFFAADATEVDRRVPGVRRAGRARTRGSWSSSSAARARASSPRVGCCPRASGSWPASRRAFAKPWPISRPGGFGARTPRRAQIEKSPTRITATPNA